MERKPNTGTGVGGEQKASAQDSRTRQTAQSAQQVQTQAEKTAREAREMAETVAAGAGGTTRETGDSRTSQDRGLTNDTANEGLQGELGHRAREIGQQAERLASSQMDRGRQQVAERVHTVGEALRLGAQQVRDREGAPGMQFVERLAEPMDRISNYLERHETREIASDLENFARRNEGLFLGGAFALGLLGARFLTSSSADLQRTSNYGTSGYQHTALVPEEDSINRPGAPGYQPVRERSTIGDPPGVAGPRDW